MTRAATVAAVTMTFLSGAAWAQQGQPPQGQSSEEVKQMCRQEIRQLCSGTFPDRSSIQRCVTENPDKFSKPCRTMFSSGKGGAAQQGRQGSN